MKIDDIKRMFEEDESLKYALATNLAKYGRPQSKKSDKPAKLTKGLEKGREKYVKDLKKSMSELDDSGLSKGYIMARDIIAMLREKVYPKLNDDELEEFGTTMHDHFMDYMNESVNEDEGTLNKIADMLSRKFDDLDFDVNTARDRIDVRGSRYDLADFGEELQGKKIFDYEVFYIEEDPGERGAIVRIVKSDSIMREDKKKADRCLRIARRKIPQSSAYRSGLIVKCRKGMIWKKEK